MPPPFPFIPPLNPWLMPPAAFDATLGRIGERVAWMRSHACPCIFSAGASQGRLPLPGSARPECVRCSGAGTYWDAPVGPFMVGVSFRHMGPTPDEPGVQMDTKWGPLNTAEPGITIPRSNPYLSAFDSGQPTSCWENASSDDAFVLVDMMTRYTAALQVGGVVALPYQQNLQVAVTGAVTVYDAETGIVSAASGYVASGGSVVLSGYPDDTVYMVEFKASPTYVAFRKAGGLPHARPFGGGTADLPRFFRLQALDIWLRQRQVGGFGSIVYPPPPPQNL